MIARVIGSATLAASVAVGLALSTAPVAGQTPRSEPSVAAAAPGRPAASRPASVGRTEDGRPDLQGVWGYATITPLERPSELGDKAEFASDAELETFEARN